MLFGSHWVCSSSFVQGSVLNIDFIYWDGVQLSSASQQLSSQAAGRLDDQEHGFTGFRLKSAFWSDCTPGFGERIICPLIFQINRIIHSFKIDSQKASFVPDTVLLKHQGREIHTVRYPSLLCWRLESDTRDSLTLAAWWTHPEAFFWEKKIIYFWLWWVFAAARACCEKQGLLFVEEHRL